jgi:hypothetical protein
MDGAQQMGSMVLYHGNILNHKRFFFIPQLDLHREGERKKTFIEKEREIPHVDLHREGKEKIPL